MKYFITIIFIIIIITSVGFALFALYHDSPSNSYDDEVNNTVTDVVREAAEDTSVKYIHHNLDDLKSASEKSIKEHTIQPLEDYSENFDTDEVADFLYNEGKDELNDELLEYGINKIKE